MKHVFGLASMVFVAGVLLSVGCPGDSPSKAAAGKEEDGAPNASDVVASFYFALVQDIPPTKEQEKELFGSSSVRGQLIDKTGMPEDHPVLLGLFRKHRDLFLPKNAKRGEELASVRISSSFTILGPPGDLVPGRGPGCHVMVVLIDDVKAKIARERTVIFSVDGHGKIEGDWICFGGFGEDSAYEKFFDEKWAIEHAGPEDMY